MKKLPLSATLLQCCFLVATSALWGQPASICREVLASGGGEAQLIDKKFEFTLGEAVVQSVGNMEQRLTQGFHQPEICPLTVLTALEPTAVAGVTVFPNPTTSTLHLAFTKPSGQIFNLVVLNAAGQAWLHYPKSDDMVPPLIDCSALPAGSYFLLAKKLNGDVFFQVPFIKSGQ